MLIITQARQAKREKQFRFANPEPETMKIPWDHELEEHRRSDHLIAGTKCIEDKD
jgi:hypothetical protein